MTEMGVMRLSLYLARADRAEEEPSAGQSPELVRVFCRQARPRELEQALWDAWDGADGAEEQLQAESAVYGRFAGARGVW